MLQTTNFSTMFIDKYDSDTLGQAIYCIANSIVSLLYHPGLASKECAGGGAKNWPEEGTHFAAVLVRTESRCQLY